MFQAAPRPAGRHAESESGPAVAAVPAAAAAGQVSPQAGGGSSASPAMTSSPPAPAGSLLERVVQGADSRRRPVRTVRRAARSERPAALGVGSVSVWCRFSVGVQWTVHWCLVERRVVVVVVVN